MTVTLMLVTYLSNLTLQLGSFCVSHRIVEAAQADSVLEDKKKPIIDFVTHHFLNIKVKYVYKIELRLRRN